MQENNETRSLTSKVDGKVCLGISLRVKFLNTYKIRSRIHKETTTESSRSSGEQSETRQEMQKTKLNVHKLAWRSKLIIVKLNEHYSKTQPQNVLVQNQIHLMQGYADSSSIVRPKVTAE